MSFPFSQFFPSGGGSSIHLEVLAVSGGGGAGAGPESNGSYIFFRPGGGGGGAAYQGMLKVAPGSTVPITIGAGGAGGTSPTPCGGVSEVVIQSLNIQKESSQLLVVVED